MLGTSGAWSTSHLSQRTSKPAYYIVDCQIFNNKKEVKNRTTAFSYYFVWCFSKIASLTLCTMDLLSKRPCQNKTPCWLGSCVQQDDRGSLENMATSHSTLGPRLFWSFFLNFIVNPEKETTAEWVSEGVPFGILKSVQCQLCILKEAKLKLPSDLGLCSLVWPTTVFQRWVPQRSILCDEIALSWLCYATHNQTKVL